MHTTLQLTNVLCYLGYLNQVRKFRKRMGYFPNIANPRTYQEKMLWRKVFDRNPKFTSHADKIRVKDIVAEKAPELDYAKILWSGTDPGEIPAEILQDGGYFKSNHGCHQHLRLSDTEITRSQLRRLARNWLRRPYGRSGAEWGYKNIRRRVFVESDLEKSLGRPLQNYKLCTCGGKVVTAWASPTDDDGAMLVGWYLDPEGNLLDVSGDWTADTKSFSLHPDYDDMIRTAELLAKDIDNVRIDFLAGPNGYAFGEYTFYPQMGLDYRQKDETEIAALLSETWDLRESWYLRQAKPSHWARYHQALIELLDQAGVNSARLEKSEI